MLRKVVGMFTLWAGLAAFFASILGARVTAVEAAEKWSRRLGGATEDIRRGIGRVTVAPGVAAASQVQKMRTKVLQSIDDGTWARNVGAVTLQSWQAAAAGKGVDRIATGANDAKPKMQRFMDALLPAVDAAKAAVDAMPSVTLDDNIARMTAYVRRMATFKKPALS